MYPIGAAGSVLVGSGWIATGSDATIGTAVLCLGIVYSAFFVYLAVRAPKRAWARSEALRALREMSFSAERVETHTSESDTRWSWEHYSRCFESPELYIFSMRHSSLLSTFVPKRAFVSPDDESNFRALAERSLEVHFRRGSS